MNRLTFISGAVALVSTLLSPTHAHAVMLGADGYGQALIFPYYTARSSTLTGAAYNTLLSVTNANTNAKALRVRFREANAGAPVLELNVFLSARDMWTAAIAPTADGTLIVSTDRSCTQPILVPVGQPSGSRDFSKSQYVGDGLNQTLARTREGYIEVLEMGTIPDATPLNDAVTHTGGQPTCTLPTDAAIALALTAPTGGLRGSATVINVEEGTSYSYDAVAFTEWRNAPLYTAVGSAQPTLTSVVPLTSTVVDAGTAYISQWTSGIDAIDAVLAAAHVESEFMIDNAVRGGTDIIYTMPTKREAAFGVQAARAPFEAAFQGGGGFGACEAALAENLDRDEANAIGETQGFCWSTSVVSMHDPGGSTISVLASAVGVVTGTSIALVPGGVTRFAAGIIGATFVSPNDINTRPRLPATGATMVVNLKTGQTTSVNGVVYLGLPVIGLAFSRFVNGTVIFAGARVLSTYGTTTTLKPTRLRTP